MGMVRRGAVLWDVELQFFIYLQWGTRVIEMLVAYMSAPTSAFTPSHCVLFLVLYFFPTPLVQGEMEGVSTQPGV